MIPKQVCQKRALKVIKLFWSNNVESCFVRVGSSAQMDATLLRSALVITEQKKCWELLASNVQPFQALCNNSQQHTTTGSNMQHWVSKRMQHVQQPPKMFHLFAWGFR